MKSKDDPQEIRYSVWNMPEHLRNTKKIRNESTRSGYGYCSLKAPAVSHSGSRNGSILLVDASEANRRDLRSQLKGYDILEAACTVEALRLLSSRAIELVVVDEQVPDLGGAALCGVIRRHFGTRFLPVLVISDNASSQDEALALMEGADDFLFRPLASAGFRARVHSLLRRGSMRESSADFESVFLSLAQAVEARDPGTGQHCHRVATICSSLGASLGLPADQLVTLQHGAFLHDIGKIAVPDHILFKAGPLSPQEWSIMQNHTTSGERICSGMRSLAPVLPIIRNHHERWDGTGYPDRLKKDQIPLLARVLQIADIFDALTTERPYKSAFSPEYAIQVLRNEVAAGWRDPAVVEALCDIFPQLEAAEAFSSASLFALSLALGESQAAGTASNAVESASVLAERQSEAETRRSRTIYQD